MPKPWPEVFWVVQPYDSSPYLNRSHPANHDGGRYGSLDAARAAAQESAEALGGIWLVLMTVRAVQPIPDPPSTIEKNLAP